jgi:uncharacterized protein (UPF0218 family)
VDGTTDAFRPCIISVVFWIIIINRHSSVFDYVTQTLMDNGCRPTNSIVTRHVEKRRMRSVQVSYPLFLD